MAKNPKTDKEKPCAAKNGPEEDKLSTDNLMKAYRISVARKIAAGEKGLASELEYLKQIDKENTPAPEDKTSEIPQPEQIGIPARLRVPREYKMSAAAIEARRKGGKASAEKYPNKNWKHGKYSRSFITGKIRPCKTTCSDYPCELIDDGATRPGEACLDKTAVLETYTAIEKSIKDAKCSDDFRELASLTIAQSKHVLDMLLEDIIRDGTNVKSERFDAAGRVIGFEIKPHPSLLAVTKLISELGMTPQEMMITPRQIAKQGNEETGITTIADLMGDIGNKIKKAKERREQELNDDD